MIRESCTSTEIRPRPSIILPERGPFPFGEPYGTTGIRLTNGSDMGGADALWPTGYAYWQAINAHAGRQTLLAFLAIDRNRGGGGPSLYAVDKGTLEVAPLGPLFPPDHRLSSGTGEGWYFSATNPAILYCSDDEHLYRLNVDTRELVTVVDITPFRWMGRFALRQWHSSHDGRVHSATVKQVVDEGPYPSIGTIVYDENKPQPWSGGCWYPKIGDPLDESQIDPSGAWLLIKEQVDGKDGEDNRIIRVADQGERVLFDRDGAAGHSDSGFGYMVAADNWYAQHNAAWRLWAFDGSEPQGRLVHESLSWYTQVQHVSHCNARPESPDSQWVVGSGATRVIGPRANEILAFPLDGSMRVAVLAPSMVDLDASGGGSDPYNNLPRANLDPYGQYILFTSNHGSDRLDGFLVQVPPALFAEG